MKLCMNVRCMQYFAAFTAALSMASSSLYVTWASPSLPNLISGNSPIGTPLTHEQASWVASSKFLGSILGGLGTGLIVERLSRKGSLLLSAVLLFLPWIGIIFAKSVMVLISARFLAGLGTAVAMTVAPMYNGEIAEKDIRGKLGLFSNLLMAASGLFVLSVGPFVSYTTLAISCSVVPLVFFVLLYFIPKSPHYLIKNKNRDEAKVNLLRLSSNGADDKEINDRLRQIENSIKSDMQNKCTLWELASKRKYRKSLIIMTGLTTLQHFSGLIALASYLQTIIESTNSSISVEASSIMFGFIQLLSVFLCVFVIDKMGRRALLIISSCGCALALTAEGVYFYLQDVVQANVDYLSWLPTTALAIYVIMNAVGVHTIPNVLLGELFAANIKGIAVSAFTVYGCTLNFLVTKFFHPISEAWELHTMFWMYAGVCCLGFVFVCCVLPETKGKTFAEIQERLNK